MIQILFGLFIILLIENHFKPRLFITDNKDLVVFYYWKKSREVFIICSLRNLF